VPVSEVVFGAEAEKVFRSRYVELFGGGTGDDPLYQAISAGQRYPGMEQWLPLFHDRLETLFDYVQGSDVSFDHLAEEAVAQRFEKVGEHYQAASRPSSGEVRSPALQAGSAGSDVYFGLRVGLAAWSADRAPLYAVRAGRAGERVERRRPAGAQFRAGAHGRGLRPVRGGRRAYPQSAVGEQPRRHCRLDGWRTRAAWVAADEPRPQGCP